MAPHPSKLSPCRKSPYAAELQRNLSDRRFSPHLEQEYVKARLAENRVLIRVACVLGALLSSFSLVRKFLEDVLSHGQLLMIVLVSLASIVLAVVACSRAGERFYLPLAQIVVPIRNALAAAFVTMLAVNGHGEPLMALPLMIVGPFFFLGLPFRAALLAVAATITAFAVSAVTTGLPLATTVYSCAILAMITVACMVAMRHMDERSRKSFLQSRLIAEFAETDALTGIQNRRMFDEQLARLWRQAIERKHTIAVLLIDVDHFKAYNDHYGHQAGDWALRRVAETLQTSAGRPLDVLARYGGEEFAAVLVDIDSRQAADIANRMRRAVSALAMEQRSADSGKVTISIGVAVLDPAADREPGGALQLADQALYEAKVRGRNRVEFKEEEDYGLLVTGVFSNSAFRDASRDATDASGLRHAS